MLRKSNMTIPVLEKKQIKSRLEKSCSICGKEIKVILYTDKSYRGGHYFFDIPISTKKEEAKARKAGTRTWKFGGLEFQVMKKDPKPYKHIEYWECPKCYWRW